MRIPKKYGESRVEHCPFCGKQAIIENDQGVPVCAGHKNNLLPELKCLCGEYLMLSKGKFGIYFSCIRCGNINLKKALEINNIASLINPDNDRTNLKSHYQEKSKKIEKGENKVIRSDDPDYFD